MAERLKVSESWLTRYLDLARLPEELTIAFANPQELGIRNAIALKALLKPDDRKQRAFAEARRLQAEREKTGVARPVLEIIKDLTRAADAPKKSGSPKKSGLPETITNPAGTAVLRVEAVDRKGVRLTVLSRAGATREEAEEAFRAVLDRHWRGS